MRILVTGAFGSVGRHLVSELSGQGHAVTLFDRPEKANRKRAAELLAEFDGELRVCWGDLTNYNDVYFACAGNDTIVHLGAVIPPFADEHPEYARQVNVGGTQNIISAVAELGGTAKVLYSSSVAVYGDRLKNPVISPDDPVKPNPDDEYAKQKLECEGLLKASGLSVSIFRLTYVVDPQRLKLHSIMYEMPPETSIEICHASDVARAISHGIEKPDIWGKTYLIAGGESCRVSYGSYLKRMLSLFGMGNFSIPRSAFRKRGYHCGFMQTDGSNEVLGYQARSLESFYNEVRQLYRKRRFFVSLIRPLARRALLKRSEYL